jgi:hypothetical protein
VTQSKTILAAMLLVLISSISVGAGGSAPDISTLAWMTGNWIGTQDGVEMEELWLPPKGNTMIAVHRDVKESRTISFEFLRIEATPEAITYWASPRARPATSFKMVEQSIQRVVFENAEHDFPRRIIYWMTADKMLHAKIEGTMGGKPASAEWTWRRTAL